MGNAKPENLGDFFNKGKKKIKAQNLNKEATPAGKAESKKADKKDNEDDNWEEEQVVAATMKVEAAGKLMREEDKKEQEEAEGKVAWATGKKTESGNTNLNEKKYPSLAKSRMHASAVAAHAAVGDSDRGLETSKNVFAAIQNRDQSDSDEDAPKSAK